MNQLASSQSGDSLWPHRVAVMLVCATFPLIWVGGLVTSYKAGMAVPDWPTTNGYNLFLYPWQTWLFGPWDLFIEHGHRLLGSLVGLLAVALVVAVWLGDRRGWVRWLSLAALAAVIAQGVIGGVRVIQDEVQLAKLHACFGPAFFALCVAMSVFTSTRWRQASAAVIHPRASQLHGVAVLTCAFAYIQLVIGAHLRHMPADWPAGTFRVVVFFHLLMALVLAGHVLWLLAFIWRHHGSQPTLVRPAAGLSLLVGLQLVVGAATWIVKYSWPSWLSDYRFAAGYTIQAETPWQMMVVTAHVAIGSLVLVTGVLLLLRALRLVQPTSPKVGSKVIALGVFA